MYQKYFKRILDIICALAAMIVFCWLYLVVAVLVLVKLGSPVIFEQERAGKDNKGFLLYKFRTMTNKRDASGNLLPDTERITKFGSLLRSTSLDELPEVWNILKGDMSVIGPRPLPSYYLPYYTQAELFRHYVRPGVSGYAQIAGRNFIGWDEKFRFDIEYVENCTFGMDISILIKTIIKFLRRDDIVDVGKLEEDESGLVWVTENGVRHLVHQPLNVERGNLSVT